MTFISFIDLGCQLIAGIELVVLAFEGKEFVVGALFDNMAVIEDDDEVGIADGAQAVGDDKGSTALHQRVHSTLYKSFCTGVDARSGLVEDEHWGIRDGCTGDGNQLAFSL